MEIRMSLGTAFLGLMGFCAAACSKKHAPQPGPVGNAPPVVNPASPQPTGTGTPFLDQKKEVGPHLEWNREVTSRSGGTFNFRVTSQGPFSVTIITDKGY